MKKLLIILFFNLFIFSNVISKESNEVSLLILDKSSSTKYEINFYEKMSFRNIQFELIACEDTIFDKYVDNIALIRIDQNNESFIGWFFKYTDELNLYSNKIYEISLNSCITKN